MKNIVICGGHMTPALALIKELNKTQKFRLYYFGRKYSLEGDNALSLEFSIIKELKINFITINPARLQRQWTKYTIISLIRLPYSLILSFYHLLKIKPKVIVSFGGYVALPVCLAGFILNIPVITHEQTTVLGLTNRIIARFAKTVFLSWPEVKYADKLKNKSLIGNLLHISDKLVSDSKLVKFGNIILPLIYVTGGSLGSKSINNLFLNAPESIFHKYRILHQCGVADNKKDFINLIAKKRNLNDRDRENYQVVPNINPQYIKSIFENCTLVIGRSGSNTITEVAAYGKPAILIPLPWSADNEQKYNAQMLYKTGLIKILEQDNLTPENFFKFFEETMENIESLKINSPSAQKLIHRNAAVNLSNNIASYAQNS